MKYILSTVLIFCFGIALSAQSTVGLIAHYSFDDCTLNDATGTLANNGLSSNDAIACECGVIGNAVRFNGIDDSVILPGPVGDEFDTEDFTFSFYFKPVGSGGNMDIFSKRNDCSNEHAFAVRYTAGSNFLNVLVSENNNKNSTITYQLPFERCWYHVAIVRKGQTTSVYVDGEFVGEARAATRVNISNGEFLKISDSPCLDQTDRPFEGLLDEIRVYNRALTEGEILELFDAPDRIPAQGSPKIFLGSSVTIDAPMTCATEFAWTPTDGVSDPTIANPVITPTEAGVTTYRLDFIDSNCVASDTIRITVIDPADLDCNLIFLPSAFTPNGDGPKQNESYGISNPEAIQELVLFEIFDRWGSTVFSTTNAFATWDGSFKGQLLNPGVFLYKVSYRCDGEEEIKAGSLTLLR